MNEKQFKFILKNWSTIFNTTANQKEALTSFLKRGLRANERQETDIKKINDKKIGYKKRQVSFIEKKTNTIFIIFVDYDLKKVSLLY